MSSFIKSKILKSIINFIGVVFSIAVIQFVLILLFKSDTNFDAFNLISKVLGFILFITLFFGIQPFRKIDVFGFNSTWTILVLCASLVSYLIIEVVVVHFVQSITTFREINVFKILSILIVSPFFEELFFRGIIQKMLQEKQKWYVAVIITSILFMLFHTQTTLYVSYFLFSVVAGYLYHKHRSVFLSILFHFFYNILIFTFSFYKL